MKVSVITVSDRASAGLYEDQTGPEIERLLRESFARADITRDLVADDHAAIVDSLERHRDSDFIFTTGGTGISPRDITPEATEEFCDRALPGVSEILRSESYKETPNALLSRGYAGLHGGTVVINFPGSMNAVRQYIAILAPVLKHAMAMRKGEGH